MTGFVTNLLANFVTIYFRTAIVALGLSVGLSLLATKACAQGGPGRVGFVATERLYADSKLAKSIDARSRPQDVPEQHDVDVFLPGALVCT